MYCLTVVATSVHVTDWVRLSRAVFELPSSIRLCLAKHVSRSADEMTHIVTPHVTDRTF